MAKEVARRVIKMHGNYVMEIKKDAHHTIRRLATKKEIEQALSFAKKQEASLTDITPEGEPETVEKTEEQLAPFKAPTEKTTSKKKTPRKGVEPPSS